jgi:hypothetical protein
VNFGGSFIGSRWLGRLEGRDKNQNKIEDVYHVPRAAQGVTFQRTNNSEKQRTMTQKVEGRNLKRTKTISNVTINYWNRNDHKMRNNCEMKSQTLSVVTAGRGSPIRKWGLGTWDGRERRYDESAEKVKPGHLPLKKWTFKHSPWRKRGGVGIVIDFLWVCEVKQK